MEENSELDLLVSYKEHAGDPRIPAVCDEMLLDQYMAVEPAHLVDGEHADAAKAAGLAASTIISSPTPSWASTAATPPPASCAPTGR